jgi:hypothetical protein
LGLLAASVLRHNVDMKTERTGTDAEQALREYEQKIGTMPSNKMDLISIEEEIRALTDARARELMAAVLKQADTDAPEVEIDGERWGNRRLHRGEYHTAFGMLAVDRSVYQRSGRGRVAVPIDLRLGVVEGRYTPKMARILTRSTALMTEEDAAGLLREVGTAMASSSTISRLPRAMGARYETRREIIEVNLRERDEIPDEAVTVQAGLDGVMVPQEGEHARPRGRKTDSPDPPRHERRYGPVGVDSPAANDGSMGRAWHEGSVGTLAFFDAEGRRLKTIYLARMPEPHKATLVKGLEAELQAVLAERPTLNIVFASDGAAPQWTALDAMAERIPQTCNGHRMKLVDAFHVAEYVQHAANAIEGIGTSDATILAATWRETIKEKVGGADTVLRSMRARRHGVTTAGRLEELNEAIGYIATQSELGRMNYPEAQQLNYPIGTGITEAAAKTIVGTRMKRAGARFSQHGGQTVMLFRAALLSGRFEALHEELGMTYRKDVRIAA